MRTSINFNHLECFLVLARLLSFSKTAEELKIAQPAVSKQIKSFEESLGVQLFIRSKKGILLTEEGKKLLQRTMPAHQLLSEEIMQFKTKSTELSGTLRFGCLLEVGEKVFVKPISEFKKLHPNLKIEIHFLKAHEIVEGIKSAELDLGIVPQKIIQENIRAYEVFTEEIILVTNRKNSSQKFGKITDLPFISFRSNDPLLGFYIKQAAPKANQSQLNIQFTVNSHKAMASMLQDHPYYAVLPKLSIMEELKAKVLVPVGEKTLKSKLYLIQQDLNLPDRKIEAIREHLQKSLRQF